MVFILGYSITLFQ